MVQRGPSGEYRSGSLYWTLGDLGTDFDGGNRKTTIISVSSINLIPEKRRLSRPQRRPSDRPKRFSPPLRCFMAINDRSMLSCAILAFSVIQVSTCHTWHVIPSLLSKSKESLSMTCHGFRRILNGLLWLLLGSLHAFNTYRASQSPHRTSGMKGSKHFIEHSFHLCPAREPLQTLVETLRVTYPNCIAIDTEDKNGSRKSLERRHGYLLNFKDTCNKEVLFAGTGSIAMTMSSRSILIITSMHMRNIQYLSAIGRYPYGLAGILYNRWDSVYEIWKPGKWKTKNRNVTVPGYPSPSPRNMEYKKSICSKTMVRMHSWLGHLCHQRVTSFALTFLSVAICTS